MCTGHDHEMCYWHKLHKRRPDNVEHNFWEEGKKVRGWRRGVVGVGKGAK